MAATAFLLAAGLALAVAIAARLRLGLNDSLWLDETWTGAFSAQSSFAALIRQVRDDANAPAYYVLIYAWAKVAGTSDLALRLPSVAFGILAPIIAWAGLRRQRPRLALTWACLVALWIPGIALSGYARGYTLLLMLAVTSCVTLARLLERPTLGRAFAWTAAATLMTLVHYDAGLLAATQALALCATLRGRAVRLWPAAILTLPGLAWIAWHAPRLAQFARPDVAWYDTFTFGDAPDALAYLVGPAPVLLAAAAAALLGLLLTRREAASGYGERAGPNLWAVGVAALGAAALCFGLGMARPSMTLRYLTPCAPGALLLVALCVAKASKGRPEPLAVLITGAALATLAGWVIAPSDSDRTYNFERASAWIAQTGPARLAFFWDHPAAPVEAPAQLDAVGGFFLRRAGLNVAVTPVRTGPADMNGAMLAAAGPQGAVIWLYDTAVHGTHARSHPPRLPVRDSGLECRDFGARNVGVWACRPKSVAGEQRP